MKPNFKSSNRPHTQDGFLNTALLVTFTFFALIEIVDHILAKERYKSRLWYGATLVSSIFPSHCKNPVADHAGAVLVLFSDII